MVTINNSEINNELSRITRLQSSEGGIPNILGDTIIPVIPLDRPLTEVIGSDLSSVSTASSFVLPSDKDIYLTGIQASYMMNVTSDNASLNVTVVPFNQTTAQTIIRFARITLTASSESIYVSFNNPIRLKRGSSIIFNGSYTAGAGQKGITAYGYYKQDGNI